MRHGLVLLLATLLSGCGGEAIFWKRINGPDPQKLTYSLTCEGSMGECYEAAARLCHGHSWRFLNTSTASAGGVFGNGSILAGRTDVKGAALLQCDWGPVQPVKEED